MSKIITYKIKNVFIQNNNNVGTRGVLSIIFSLFPVLSGKYGNGTLPVGIYKVEKPILLKDDGSVNAYKKEWLPWYAPLKPQFNCNRTGLMIHPDGNIEGTLGCLGIAENDKVAFELLLDLTAKENVMLHVT